MTDLSEKQKPGEARGPGPTLAELLREDSLAAPPQLLEEHYEFLGDDDIPYDRYTSPEFARREFENLWPKVWQWACREEHIPDAGDYFVYDLGDMSALIVRTESGQIKAYYNACMHRGTALKPPASCGRSKQLKCPFHGWTWNLEGKLVDLPGSWDFPHAGPDTHALDEMPLGLWAGFVFVNFDKHAAPLEEYLGVLPEHFKTWGLENRYIETHVQKRLPCNWKAGAEAFLEAYHVQETHGAGYRESQVTTGYDLFGPNVTRFIHTDYVADDDGAPYKSQQERLNSFLGWAPESGDPEPELPEGQTARDVLARTMQAAFGAQYGRDFSNLGASETLDSIEYYLFPNMFFFPGLGLGMTYRFRPDPTNPDYSVFDLLMLRPTPAEGDPPPPADPVIIDVDDSYTQAETLGGLGAVYDQDTANMAAQTRGFKASRKRGQTLGNYQEVRARFLHKRVDDYLSSGR